MSDQDQPTSDVTCQNCGEVGTLPLSQSVYECDDCGEETWTYSAPEADSEVTASDE